MYSVLVAVFLSLLLVACGGDEPNPDDEPQPDESENVDPSVPTEDPVGTIKLAMNNEANGGTKLDYIGIGKDNNFYGDCDARYYRLTFCDLGEIAGLGNITGIPVTGWATKVQVIPGHGYIAVKEAMNEEWDGYESTYKREWKIEKIYRIFVTDWIGSVEGGIIGVNIKYQAPFEGADNAITIDKTSVEISEDKPTAEIAVTNKSFVPFEIVVEGPFKVERIYGANNGFIAEGLTISNGNSFFAPEEMTGKVKLVTAFGKTTEITITRKGSRPYISLQSDELSFECRGLYEGTVNFSDNITTEISATSESEWIKAKITTTSDTEGYVTIITSTNCSDMPRTGYVELKSGTTSQSIKVTQSGFASVPAIPEIIETGPERGWRTIHTYDGSPMSPFIDFRDVEIRKEQGLDWVSNVSKNYQNFELHLDTNDTGTIREGKIYVYYQQHGVFDDVLITSFTVRQLSE